MSSRRRSCRSRGRWRPLWRRLVELRRPVGPEELRQFKNSLRRFVNNELIPVERDTVAAEGEEIKPHYLERFIAGSKKLGIWMMEVPEEYGGGGLSLLTRTIVMRNQKARFLAVSLVLFVLGFGLYCFAIAQLLLAARPR